MLAGTIVALGGLGPRAGAGMRRGSIVTMAPATPLATFVFACVYRPPFLRLYLRRLRALGLPVTDEQLDGRYSRWSGDGLELRRGEILILERMTRASARMLRRELAWRLLPRRDETEAAMTLSLNDRAVALADRLAADAEALQVDVTTLSNGTRLIDCGAGASRRGAPSPRSAWRGWGAWRTRRWCSKVAGCPR